MSDGTCPDCGCFLSHRMNCPRVTGRRSNEHIHSLEDQLATLRAEAAYVRGHLEGYADAATIIRTNSFDLARALREDSRRLGKLGGGES